MQVENMSLRLVKVWKIRMSYDKKGLTIPNDGVIRNSNSKKTRQYNDQKKENKSRNHGQQNTMQTTKD